MRIDAHTHCYPPSFAGRRPQIAAQDATFAALFADQKARLATAEDLVAALDRAAIDAAVAAGIGWTDPTKAHEANDYILESARRFPGRIIPFCSVNPAWGEAALGEVERCAGLGALGVGELHPDTQGFRLDDSATLGPFARQVAGLGMAVLTHVSEPVGHRYPGKGAATPEQALAFAQAFPDVRLICAHWGGGLPFYALMPEVAEAMRNVWFDSAASPYLYRSEVFPTVAGLVGADKVLFGSDFPVLRPERVLKDLHAGGLSDDARQAILGGNAASLLRLAERGWRGRE